MPLLKSSLTNKNTDRAHLSISAADLAVYLFIFLIGVFQFTHYLHAPDFWADATYPELARSLLQQGSYQIGYMPQTTLPPGFPLILAAVGRFFGLAPVVFFHVIALSTTLALIAAYELLRRVGGRGVAVVASLLLASSPALFVFSSILVFPEMPYFLASMLALLLALKIDRAEPSRTLIGWELLLGITLALAVLIRSVGVAILGGLVVWIAASFWFAAQTGWRRTRRFLLPLALGLVAQLGWSVWAQHHQTLEWKLPGYPQSYVSQLKVKNGQYPELGMARLADIPPRIETNIVTRAAGLSQILIRRSVAKFWSSPFIIGVVMLVAIGLLSSLRAGGQLHDWYFLCYEFIFMLWPWDYRDRFVFPVVPLACLYLWRGGKQLAIFSKRQPRTTGALLVITGCLFSGISAAFAFGITPFPRNLQHVRGDHLQTIAATLFWAVLAAAGFAIFKYSSSDRTEETPRILARLNERFGSALQPSLRLVSFLAVVAIVFSGTRNIVQRGRDNLHPAITQTTAYPEIQASEWIRTHEPSNLVIMAREPDMVFHITHRRVVWFPPISDPAVLMEGIRRYHVGVLLVAHHADSYWLPPEDICFQALSKAYANAFQLRYQDPTYSIFEVATSADSAPVASDSYFQTTSGVRP